MIQLIKDFFLPYHCPVCGKVDKVLCNECYRELGYSEQICPMCEEFSAMGWTHKICKKKPGLDGLISIYQYGDPAVRKVIDDIKYEFNRDLVRTLFSKMALEVGEEFNLVVPVPLHFYRQNWRGFNQAEVIGKEVGEKLKVPCISVVKRTRNTPQQAKMESRTEREENVKGAFELDIKSQISDLKSKKVLLVDDVFTTGASMRECCKVLKIAGVETVWGLVLAH